MWTWNAMRLKAQREKILKIEMEADRIKCLTESLRTRLDWILNEIPTSLKWEDKLTLSDFLLHIQKPKGYSIERQRGAFLDAMLLSTWLPIWHINGQPITGINQLSQSKTANDIVMVVNVLLKEINDFPSTN